MRNNGVRLLFAVFIPVLILVPSIASLARSPSFDCARASAELEKIICGDVVLSKLDQGLAVAYAGARAKAPNSGREILQEGQRKWLKALRVACLNRVMPKKGKTGYDPECLRTWYQEQIDFYRNDAVHILPGGKIVISRQLVSAIESTLYEGEETCSYSDSCIDLIKFTYPVFPKPIGALVVLDIEIPVPQADARAQTHGGFQVLTATRKFVSIEQSQGYSAEGKSYPSYEAFTYTVDLRSGKRLIPETIFSPDQPWRSFLVENVKAVILGNGDEGCPYQPTLTPPEWEDLILAPGRWSLKETDLVISFDQNAFATYRTPGCTICIPLKLLKRFMTPETRALIDWRKLQ